MSNEHLTRFLILTISCIRCRELQTVEALAWTAMALAAVTLLSAIFAIHSTRRKHGYRARYTDLVSST